MKKFLSLILLSAIVIIILPVALLKENLTPSENTFSPQTSTTEASGTDNTLTVFRSVNQENINVDFFEYVCGSVAAEMPLSYHEEALKAQGIVYQALKLPMAYSGRFVAENEGVNGVCKVLVAEDGTVLGASMLGNPASELIIVAGMAIEDGKKVEDWKHYVFPHPTAGEIFREF